MKFIPTYLWLCFCALYFELFVGAENFFAQMPWEVFASMQIVALIPVINWFFVVIYSFKIELARQ